jgi:hypothetical protein
MDDNQQYIKISFLCPQQLTFHYRHVTWYEINNNISSET